MTNKEAIKILKNMILEDKRVYGDKPKQRNEALDLAIKALEIVDDVNHKVYRNENCPRKNKCYDYQGYHCAGCGGNEK